MEEVRRSLLTALIDRKINKYIGAVDGILKKHREGQVFLRCETEIYGADAGGTIFDPGRC